MTGLDGKFDGAGRGTTALSDETEPETEAMGSVWMIGAMLLGIGAAQAAESPLAKYRWSARVLIVSASGPSDPKLAAQRAILAEARTGIRDRDLVVLEAVGTTPDARRLRGPLGLPEGDFRVVLIGKDGAPKRTESAPLPVDALFETIDAMPMRREEARQDLKRR